MSIYVTGDIHLNKDIHKLNSSNFKEQKCLSKNDHLIILGDAGLTWDKSSEVKYWVNWLNTRNYTTLIVPGNHENYDLLHEYPITEYKQMKVRQIADSIFYLERGQIFELEGLTFFTLGGASSIDKDSRVEGVSWWKQEIPSEEQMTNALHIIKENSKVDYVLTHDCPYFISLKLLNDLGSSTIKDTEESIKFKKDLERIVTTLDFSKWYFGHYHMDWKYSFSTMDFICLYDDIIKIEN